MIKLYCKDHKELECCSTCHSEDTLMMTEYEGFNITYCCNTIHQLIDIVNKKICDPAINIQN